MNQPSRMIPNFPAQMSAAKDFMPHCAQITENKETKEETNPFATNNKQKLT